jgi:hypothetical protein
MQHDQGIIRKCVSFDTDTWYALDRLGKDSMKSMQELADEAFGVNPRAILTPPPVGEGGALCVSRTRGGGMITHGVRARPGGAWPDILCVVEECVVGNDNTVARGGRRPQLPCDPHFVRAKAHALATAKRVWR